MTAILNVVYPETVTLHRESGLGYDLIVLHVDNVKVLIHVNMGAFTNVVDF